MKYNPALDGIRALAVFIVLLFHARAPVFSGGFLGVDVFFVLSGYLITRLLAGEHERTGSIAIGAFYLRRLRRLYPALLVFIVAYLACAGSVFPGTTNHLRDATVAALYLADYGRAFWRVPEVLQHTWSLSVEEHFYLLWPWVLLIVLRLEPRRRLQVLLAAFVLATGWRWAALLWTDDWRQVYYRFDTRLSGLCLGALIALWRPKAGIRVAAVGAVLLAIALSQAVWRAQASLLWVATVAEIGSGMLVLGAAAVPRLLAFRPLPWLGRMSYGIYLWHYPVTYWMRDMYFGWQETFVVAAVLSVTLAALSHYLVEIRFHRPHAANGRGEVAGLAAPGGTGGAAGP